MPNSPEDSLENSEAIGAGGVVSATEQGAANLFLVYPENQKYLDGELDQPVVHFVSPFLFALVWTAVVFFATCIALVPYALGVPEGSSSPLHAAFFIIPASIFLCFFIYRWQGQRQLLREGQILDGRVLHSQVAGNEKLRFWLESVWVRYLFRSPAGKTIHGNERVPQEGDRGIPAPGTPVKILYFSDRNFKIL